LDLRERAAAFAQELQETLSGVLPGDFQLISVAHNGRYVVRPAGSEAKSQRVPLYIGEVLAAKLKVQVFLGLDHSGEFLKTMGSAVAIESVLDRTPLIRQEFRSDMAKDAPFAHWHIHADRGALSHLLGQAHAVRSDVVQNPHDMSSLHFPVGGERFRPCVEDVLEFAVRELGVDCKTGWEGALKAGREKWRRRQFRTTVRDLQEEAADVLRKQGWTLTPPDSVRTEGTSVLHRW
jgi:hypothetical protein